ncbi:MAG: hypothetical protein ACTHJM_16125 [Marmoricola sp.]
MISHPGKRWHVSSSPFWTLAGREFYWPAILTIWHVDPSRYDSNQDCPYSGNWQWHIHHWKLQIHPLQHFRRWAFTRCEWCSGRSRKGDYVNNSRGWERAESPWWKGERGLYHDDCLTVASAHEQCACDLGVGGPWEHETGDSAYGNCATCGKFRGWQGVHDRDSPRDEGNRILQTVPKGQRDPDKMQQVRSMWKAYRAADRPEQLI